MSDNYTVWVGGVEVNARYLDFEEAAWLKSFWENKGYDDVVLERIKDDECTRSSGN